MVGKESVEVNSQGSNLGDWILSSTKRRFVREENELGFGFFTSSFWGTHK